MRFLDYLFHGKELKAIGNYFKMLNGYSPTFTSFSGGVYEMDLTRTAVNNFATHCSKLKPEIEGSALDDVAQEGVDELQQSSPKLTGSYRRGWRKKQTYADTRTKRNTVFNKTDYQITHLLEYGHASRNGGRVKPRVHIKSVEEKMVTELQERIEKAVQQ